MKTTSAILFIALMAFMVSAQQTTIDLSTYPRVKYDQPLQTTVGQTFQVLLRENPSTGYTWQVLDTMLAAQNLTGVIRLTSSTFEQDSNRRGAVGVGGIRTLEFEVIGVGAGDLNLVHARSWELQTKIDNGEDISEYVKKILPLAALAA